MLCKSKCFISSKCHQWIWIIFWFSRFVLFYFLTRTNGWRIRMVLSLFSACANCYLNSFLKKNNTNTTCKVLQSWKKHACALRTYYYFCIFSWGLTANQILCVVIHSNVGFFLLELKIRNTCHASDFNFICFGIHIGMWPVG